MKKVLPIILFAAIAVLMVACTSNPATTKTTSVLYEDTVGFAQFQSWKAMNERIDPNEAFTTQAAVKKTSTATKKSSMNSSTTNNAKVAKKKGWSKAAKYSAIGGGTGIVLGAVINKRNRVVGGALGGILGGGLGYVLGRSKDKKEGRY
jgi:hypothetical protein